MNNASNAGNRSRNTAGRGRTGASAGNRRPSQAKGTGRNKKTGGSRVLTAEEKSARMRKRIVLIAVEVFFLIMLSIALYVVILYKKIDHENIDESQIVINEGLEQQDVGIADDPNGIVSNEGVSMGSMKGYRNVALFGLDARDKSLGKGNRSDTIIVASINEETKDVKLVSVYRDTYLNLGNDRYGKCNSAYANGGALQAINMLNMNLDLNITDYITVGWAGVADTIDALGGVEIEVDSEEITHLNNYQVETSKSLGKSYTKVSQTGMQTLDGIQAVSYCRIRYTAGDDFKRTERQREVIQAILDKAKKSDFATLNKAANTIFEEISTSLTLTEILDLLKDVSKYSIAATDGFPNEQYRTTGMVKGASSVMSTDMVNDVKILHEFLFGPGGDYYPSSQVQTIAAKVHADTGA
ncbi:MAG: LCP family protein [Lachnospiraceae bacterium]|nr:LCP family protein [Lachnospiraceae bacterium]